MHEKIEGLNAGADDYLTKPFQVAELVARVQALVRRAAGTPAPSSRSVACVSTWRLPRCDAEGTLIKLTAHEFRVLGCLMQHRGKVVSRSELIDHIYAQGFDRDSNTVEVFIGRIRKKTHADLIEDGAASAAGSTNDTLATGGGGLNEAGTHPARSAGGDRRGSGAVSPARHRLQPHDHDAQLLAGGGRPMACACSLRSALPPRDPAGRHAGGHRAYGRPAIAEPYSGYCWQLGRRWSVAPAPCGMPI